jgi:5-methylthioadenosine/S-adenosylhomocysteine deaminase
MSSRARTAAVANHPLTIKGERTASSSTSMSGGDRTGDRPVLIRGAGVITMDPAIGELGRADILVRGSMIVEIGERINATPDAEVIESANMIALPGFVDGHRHMWEGVIRGTLPTEDLAGYFHRVNHGFAPAFSPEDAYIGTLISAYGALDAGVTTVFDWSHIQNSPEHTTACISALRESGVRAVFAFGPGTRGRTRWPDDVLRLKREEFASDHQLVTLALAGLSPENVPDAIAKAHFALAREAGVILTVHAGLAGMGTPGAIERYGEEGQLGPYVNLVHCNTLSETEWRIIAETGTSVSITPAVEMQMGHGVPPIQQAMDAGVKPSLGVDVETTVPGDMFTQMRTIYGLQRMNAFSRSLSGQEAPRMLGVKDVLEYATVAGAIATGLGDRIGMLSPGRQADIVLLRADTMNTAPISDMLSAVVLNMDARNVDTVMVAGHIVKRDGQMLGIDRDQLVARLYAARDRVFKASNTPLASTEHRCFGHTIAGK